jgi:hypothetical protein
MTKILPRIEGDAEKLLSIKSIKSLENLHLYLRAQKETQALVHILQHLEVPSKLQKFNMHSLVK